MQPKFQRSLQACRAEIRHTWEGLLRIERVNTPLANPDTLVHMLDSSLDEIFQAMSLWSARRHPSHHEPPPCPCGRNPFLAYFAAGRQAMREALIIAQFESPELSAADRDESLACLDQVFDRIARREIGLFCTICQSREAGHAHPTPARQPHPSPQGTNLTHLV